MRSVELTVNRRKSFLNPSGAEYRLALVWHERGGRTSNARAAHCAIMLDQTIDAPQVAAEILGDLTALAAQLGSTEELEELTVSAASLAAVRVRSLPELRRFLDEYTSGVLVPHELPVIAAAYLHASKGQARELIALDRTLREVPVLQGFAAASGYVGRTQLRRLRPLRSERVVQRYWQASETREAQAWHTLVFGLVLSVYSLPLRQGLIHYAHQTLAGFVHAAGTRFQLRSEDRLELVQGKAGVIREAVGAVLLGQDPLAEERRNLSLLSG